MTYRHLAIAVSLLAACGGSTVPLGQTKGDAGDTGGSGGASTGGNAGTGGTAGGSGGAAGGAGGGTAGYGGDTLANDGTQATSDKLDLLLVVDNSVSMADKQAILAESASYIVQRLVNPFCVGQNGAYVATPATPNDPCPTGSTRELAPVKDIHIGVLSSSLGAAGAELCSPASPQWGSDGSQNDHGHLIGTARATITPKNNGVISWGDPGGSSVQDTDQLTTELKNQIIAVGEHGCGFESTLESMYHFLVDPKPWTDVNNVNGETKTSGLDQALLDQRSTFLRPDSAVMVVVLTDEDDCSIADEGVGWLVGYTSGSGHLPRATSVCATNPDDPCCYSCGITSPPVGCPVDPVCTGPGFTDAEDNLNLRCFEQKRRYGMDLLYPTLRYANALRLSKICPANKDLACQAGDTPVDNPLFTGGRSRSLVSFEVITGVPWQDVARNPNGTGPLSYMTSNELVQNKRWSVILGDPETRTPPTDPFMLESFEPRSGTNPITGDAIAPPSSAVGASAINGHEFDIPGHDDLEYACTFALNPPKDCANPTGGCDCESSQVGDRPLCQDPSTGAYGTLQFKAKAFPGLRQLEVARILGYKGIVASICPKQTSDSSASDYAYNPAVQGIVERLNRVMR